MSKSILSLFIILIIPALCNAQNGYTPSKVVYDVSTPDAIELGHILDRAGLLQKVYDNNSFEASIVIVLHEGSIPLFAKSAKNQQLIQRAESLTLGEIIQFRLCKTSAQMQGYQEKDFKKFVRMVPMADAEIIQLQNQGYAYMR